MVLLSSVSLTEKLVSKWEISWGMVSARRWFMLERVMRRRMFWGSVSIAIH